jgi:hypothetical protein
MNKDDGVEVFYQSVAALLQCDSHYTKFPYGRRTRWNNRSAGNGRFSGHGLVRYFGSNHIHVQLVNPPVNGLYRSADDALMAISLGVSSA